MPFETLYLPGATSGIALDLKRNIQAGTNAKVVDDPKAADAVLQFTEEARQKEILSLTGTGRVREFQLRYRVGFRVHDGKGAITCRRARSSSRATSPSTTPRSSPRSRRSSCCSATCRADMVQQIMRRLAAAKRPQAAPCSSACGCAAEQLDGQLAKNLAAVYAILGDEPLLVLEAADAVRAAARKSGFAEREVFEPGRSFDWSELAPRRRQPVAVRRQEDRRAAARERQAERAGGRGDRRLVRAPESGDAAPAHDAAAGGRRLVGCAVVHGARQRRRDRRSAARCARAALPAWLEKRLARQKQSAPREVLEYLADRVEGNLLAAHQELQKLGAARAEGELAMETVRGAVADVARFDTYVAAEALVAGDTARYLRVLEGLRGEGEAPTYLLFTISTALFALASGERAEQGAAGGARQGAALPACGARSRDQPRRARSTARSRVWARASRGRSSPSSDSSCTSQT